MLSTWLRSIGGTIQILGVLTVAIELRRVRQVFPLGRIGLVQRVLRRLVHRKPQTHAVHVGAAIASVGVVGTAEGQAWSDQWDADRKTAELRKQVSRLHEKVGEVRRQLREEGAQRREEIRDHVYEVREQIQGTDEKVSQLATGSIHVRWYGLALLLPGIALTTWPTEIARWLGGS